MLLLRRLPNLTAWHTDSVHAGAAALLADLKRWFWIDRLVDTCKRVSRHCPVCQAAHAPNHVKEGMLLTHPVPDRVMLSISLDTFHIGKAKGEDGREYDGVVVCMDRLSGVLEPILFEGLIGEKIGKVLAHQWLSVLHVPVKITTDHDPKFTSAWFDTLCSGLGVSVGWSKVYRSQTNGRAEVAGHQLFQILSRIHLEEAPHGISCVQCIWAVLWPYRQNKIKG